MSSPAYQVEHILALTERLDALRARHGIVWALVVERQLRGRPFPITESGTMPMPALYSATKTDERIGHVQLFVAQGRWALIYWVPEKLVTPAFETALVDEAARMNELVCEAINASMDARMGLGDYRH